MKDEEKYAAGNSGDSFSEDDTREIAMDRGEKPDAEAEEAPAPQELDELRAKAAERDKFLDQLQRATADFINYQKRMAKERQSIRQAALRDLMEALLPVLDNLEHAIAAAKNSPDKALLEGVTLARDEALRIFGNFGVEQIRPVAGERFDPNLHEAVMIEETDNASENTVTEEVRTGYTLDGKTLRATQVKVARKPLRG